MHKSILCRKRQMDITEWIGIMSADVEPSPKYRKRVAERDAAGLCLKCDSPSARRGLCNSCYHRFRMDRLETPKNKRLMFEHGLVRKGELMPDRQGQRIERPHLPTVEQHHATR